MICILAEKGTAKERFREALGSDKNIIFVAASGHLYEYPSDPSELGAPKDWSVLPWDESNIEFKKRMIKGRSKVVKAIREGVSKSDEVVIATDDDPSGEGTLLAVEILERMSLRGKKVSRMFFSDLSKPSVQKAFKNRVPITNIHKDPDFIKSDYRCKWDYLSMQFTRAATNLGGTLLRNGRLKSFMNVLVGDQLAAIAAYKKDPVYERAFQDEKGHYFTRKNEEKVPDKSKVDLKGLHESPVVVDKREKKTTAPPALLDLAGLTSILRGKGMDIKDCLDTYQRMYENDIVSYPRTEDQFISIEEFNEMLPLVDKIADVIGVDKSILTHRAPRKSHVHKEGGAHGANRPGTHVPKTLDELTKFGNSAPAIYKLLAKNFLTMFCEDYEYEKVTAHVKDFPEFIGTLNSPLKAGFKVLTEAELKKDSFGKTASPAIKETVKKKPPYPTMRWLVEEQLKKYNVGTGATRASTYLDMCSGKPLFKDTKGRISLTKAGEMNYKIVKGTAIGSDFLTKQVQGQMKDIANGQITDTGKLLKDVKNIVVKDIKVMQENAKGVSAMQENQERYQGIWQGQEISIKKVWGGHTFTPEEAEKLFNGETIEIKGKYGPVKGKLGPNEFNGHKFISFCPDYLNNKSVPKEVDPNYATGMWNGRSVSFKRTWSGHRFTDEEVRDLLNDEIIYFTAVSQRTKNSFNAKGKLEEQEYNGRKYVGFKPDFS